MPAPKYQSSKLPLIIFGAEMFSYQAFELKTKPLLVSINLVPRYFRWASRNFSFPASR